jgi:hypothetical protein
LIFEKKNMYALLAAALGARECVFVCRAASRCVCDCGGRRPPHTKRNDLTSPILLQPAASNCEECAHSAACENKNIHPKNHNIPRILPNFAVNLSLMQQSRVARPASRDSATVEGGNLDRRGEGRNWE